ncbi:MAG: hypothetical protein ACM3JG_02820 [Thiohalocapsa sp.]
MISTPADAVAWLTDLLLPAMRYRAGRLGGDESGAFDFYRARIAAGQVFLDYEVRLLKAIIAQGLPIDEIHEIGCGWGQLVFLLAWNGFKATGFEVDERRFAGALCLHQILAQVDPSRTERARIRNEFFPPLDRPDPARSAVIATNVVIGNPHLFEEEMIWGLRRYRFAIIDVDRFCRQRRPEERPGLIALVEESGLRNLGPFCEAGADGTFYLFTSADSDENTA